MESYRSNTLNNSLVNTQVVIERQFKNTHPALLEEYYMGGNFAIFRAINIIAAFLSVFIEIIFLAIMNDLGTGIKVGLGIVYIGYSISNLAYAALREEQKAKILDNFKYILLAIGVLMFLPMIYPFGPIFIIVVALGAEKAPFFLFVTALLVIYL